MLKKLSEKYRGLNAAVKMSFWYLVCNVLQKGIGMISTPIFTRIMTESEFGRYSIYNSWTAIFMAIVSLNIAGGFYMRGLVLNEDDRDGFTSALVGLTGVLCAGAAGVYLILHDQIDRITGLTRFLTVLIFVRVFFQSGRDFWLNRRRAVYNYRPIVKVTAAGTILIPILSILFVLLSDEQHQVESRAVAVLAVDIGLYSWLTLAVVRTGRKVFDSSCWKEALLFSLPLIPHNLSMIVLNQADRVMIGRYCGFKEAGYYSVAYSLAAVFLIINMAVAASMGPWLYNCIKNRSLQQIRSISMKVLMVMAVLNLGVIAIAPEVLRIFAPPSFYAAVWIIPPVTASVFFMFMYDMFTTFQYYYAKTKWVMYASLTGAALNVGLNMIFIPRFGFIAAGYTTLVCYILFGCAHYFFMCKVCDQFMEHARPYDFRQIFAVGLVLLAGAGIMTLLYPFPVIRYCMIAGLLILATIKRKKLLSILKVMKKEE